MAFLPIGQPNPTATLPWYERMNPFGDFVPAAEKSARAQGLLQLGLGILANNQGNYGATLPALARGGMQGMQAYQGALSQQSQKKRNALQDKLLGAQVAETAAQAQERQAKLIAEQQARQALEQKTTAWRSKYSPKTVSQPDVSGSGMQFIDIQSPDQLPANVETVPGEPNMFTARVGDNKYAAYRLTPNALPAGVDPMQDPAAVRELAGMLIQDPRLFKQSKEMYDLAEQLRKAKTEGKGFMSSGDGGIVMTDVNAGTATPIIPSKKTPKTLPGAPYYSYKDDGSLEFNQEVYNRVLAEAKARGTNVSFGQPIAVDDGNGGQTLVQVNPQGQVNKLGLKPGGTLKTTDGERLTKGYHDRMVAAEAIMRDVGSKGFPNEATAAGRSIPLVGAYVERRTMTPAQQQFRQAQEDWVRSKLRKESGAAIGKEEMNQEIATYFPQPGDTPQVITQKQGARDVAIAAMRDAAGPAIPGNTSTRGSVQEQSAFGGGELPKAAKMNLQEGKVTTFKNGQSWTLRGGQPVRVK